MSEIIQGNYSFATVNLLACLFKCYGETLTPQQRQVDPAYAVCSRIATELIPLVHRVEEFLSTTSRIPQDYMFHIYYTDNDILILLSKLFTKNVVDKFEQSYNAGEFPEMTALEGFGYIQTKITTLQESWFEVVHQSDSYRKN